MQVVFAVQNVVNTSGRSYVEIYNLNDEVTQTIPLNRIKQGQSFVDDETVTGVEISIHNYKPTIEEVVVYDASESGTGQNIFVKFGEPLHDLNITNGTFVVDDKGNELKHTNYAVINANEGCVLVGEQYAHTTQTRHKYNELVLAGEREKIITIDNATDVSYDEQFYKMRRQKKSGELCIYGFPCVRGAWCNSKLKMGAINKAKKPGAVHYIGIAADEPSRFHNLTDTKKSPLVELGWDEAYCRKWCEENDLLSPIYTTATRGGCWFCHNQGVGQLRLLRRNYPELWAMMLKWDLDSPVTFKPDGHTIRDFDKRFQLEDEGFISTDDKVFRWTMLDEELNYRLF